MFKNAIIGALVGDALGVPWEFKSRQYCVSNKDRIVINTDERGEHGVKPGTYSDDGSLTIATVSALINGYDIERLGYRCAMWYFGESHPYSSTGTVFDIGGTTANALTRIWQGASALNNGAGLIHNNGNGSLMRILPVALYLSNEKDLMTRWKIVSESSAITHANLLSKLCCWFYCDLVINLMEKNTVDAIGTTLYSFDQDMFIIDSSIKDTQEYSIFKSEMMKIYNLINCDFYPDWKDDRPVVTFDTLTHNSGYVINTLVNALYCLVTNDNYRDVVTTAVMLGDDTDTVACVVGGLAGLIYEVPEDMINNTIIPDYVNTIIDNFCNNYESIQH